MSAAAPAPLRRPKKFFDETAFKELHEATGKLDFTPDFNPSIEAILNMRDVALPEKLIALVKLQAWGNQKKFAVRDGSRNTPFTEADCARQFHVSRQTINRQTQKLIARCQLRVEDGKLYPVIDPEAERRLRSTEVVTPGSDNPSPNLRLLKKGWFAEHPDIHEQYQKAFQYIDAINRQIQADLREKLSPPGVTTPSGVSEPRGGHEQRDGVDTSNGTGRTTARPIFNSEKEELEQQEPTPPNPPLAEGEPRAPSPPPPASQAIEPVSNAEAQWKGFSFLAQQVGMENCEGEWDDNKKLFCKLSNRERYEAVKGIEVRALPGMQYARGFIPTMRNYLRKRLWTGPLRGIPPPLNDRKAAAREEFLEIQRRRADAAKN